MPGRVLIVSTVERPDLAASVAPDASETVVVVPVVEQTPLEWLANDTDAQEREARDRAAAIADAAPGRTIEARAGEANPIQSVVDAVAEFAPDEIVLVTRVGEDASWLEREAGSGQPAAVDGIPIRHVTVDS